MNQDVLIALVLCAATIVLGQGLWWLARRPHGGRVLAAAGVVAVALLFSPRLFPAEPRSLIAVGGVLAAVVTFGVLFWRHRDDPGGWVDVATVRYVKPLSVAERIGTGVVAVVLGYVIIGSAATPLRLRVAAGLLFPMACYVVITGKPPRSSRKHGSD